MRRLIVLLLVTALLAPVGWSAQAQTGSFVEAFDGDPGAPAPFVSDRWDVAVHARDNREPPQSPMAAHHGPGCEAPVADAGRPVSASNPLVLHPTNGSAGAHVFRCKDHLMTSVSGGGYAAIYLTPNHQADWSGGEAVIRWDMSTYRSSERDWIDVWLTPFEDNLQLPLNPGFPDLQGPPRRAIQLLMDPQSGALCPNFYAGGSGVGAPSNCRTPAMDSIPGFPDLSPTRRDQFEIRISRTRLVVRMPAYDYWFYDGPLPAGFDWTRAVVQFGHHAYTPEKGTHRCPAGGCTTNTWHWDNVNISPAVPFTIIKGDKRYVAGSGGSISTSAATVTFSQPAPANSYLRFSGWAGWSGNRAIDYSTDDGTTWRRAGYNPQDNDCCHITSYWSPVPAGTTRVRFRSPELGWPWTGTLKDFSIWSQSMDGQPPPPSNTPLPPSNTPLPPSDTPVPTNTPTAPTETPVVPQDTPIPATMTPEPSSTPEAATATPTVAMPEPTPTLEPEPTTGPLPACHVWAKRTNPAGDVVEGWAVIECGLIGGGP